MAIAPSFRPLPRRGATHERCTDLLSIRTEEREDDWRISISGELDMSTAWVLEQELLEVEAKDSRPIVIDLRQLTFMGAVGLHLLLAATRRSEAGSRQLAIVRGPTAVQRVFDVTRTDALLPFIDQSAAGVS